MTDSEYPDSFAGLFGGLDADSRSSLAAPSGDPARAPAVASGAPVVSGETAGFASRREMREAGGYRLTEPAPAGRAAATSTRRKAKRTRTRDVVRAQIARPAQTSLRRKLSSAGVMTVIFGIFASLTLPAFAGQNDLAGLAENAEPLDGQTLEITAATTDESAVIRDGYGTTSAADLRKLYADAIRQQNLQAYLASGAREMGDDYPWPEMLSRPQGGGLSPLNYYYRECVDFVAWRLNRDAGSTGAPFKWVWSNLAQGSAYSWKNEWQNHGWPTGTTPEVGAVAWVPGGNHVAYVSGILGDGSVVLEEYNYNVDHGYSQRVVPAGSVYYLYAPPS